MEYEMCAGQFFAFNFELFTLRFLSFLSLIAFSSFPASSQASDASTIWISAYGWNYAQRTLTFGNRIGNTWGLDTSANYPVEYREQEPPPTLITNPPPGFDVVWKATRAGQFGGYRALLDHDYRDFSSPFQRDTFRLSFVQADNSSATISFKWPDSSYLSAHCDTLFLKYTDPIDGPILIDMFAQDSLVLPMAGDRGISLATIYKTGVHLVETGVVENYFPTSSSLSQNYPNPFNPLTVIRYQLLVSGRATMKLYDLVGREIATLVDETKPPGTYEATWDASKVSSGVYYYRLQAGTFVETKKMVVLR